MKISLNWIKDYVDLTGISTDEIIRKFTLSTAEIEDVTLIGNKTNGVVFAKILEVNSHPQSQKLHILKVDKGDEIVQIVCGAPNVRVGMITCLATLGGCVNGNKIKLAKLAGIESYGMCCSEAELGIGSDDNGIMDIVEDVKIGDDIKTHWQIDDVIIEIDNKSLTNRPDLWGHYGIARELSAIFGRELKPLNLLEINDNNKKPLKITIESQLCYRYSAITVSNVTRKVSPTNIKIRLNYIEQKDINFLADLTNYVMFEIGQPMHAFDNKIVKEIIVDESKAGEKLLTLENEEHLIPLNTITIYDQNKNAIALAGIKGGLKASISESTTDLLLESANFESSAIRKASIAIGLRTQSSLRYEKTLDPEMTITAIKRLVFLLKKYDQSVTVTSAMTDVYKKKYDKILITTSFSFLKSRIGIEFDHDEAVKRLTALGFNVSSNDDLIKIEVPSYRATKDVSGKEDIVEEVARMIGYDNIVAKQIKSNISPVKQSIAHIFEYESKRLLSEKYGLNEVHSYIWNYVDFNKEHKINENSVVKLLDSSNSGQSGIRKRLLPTLIKFFDENKNSNPNMGFYEIGRVAESIAENGLVSERKKLAIVLASIDETEENLYFRLKNITLDLSKNLLSSEINFIDLQANDLLHPVNSCAIVDLNNTEVGIMGIANPSLGLDKKFNIALLEIDCESFVNMPKNTTKIKEVSKFQEVSLDFNFLVNRNIKYNELQKAINEFKCNYDLSYSLKDIYDNKTSEKISFTFNFKIASREHTLSSKEIDGFSFRIVDHMKRKGFDLKQ